MLFLESLLWDGFFPETGGCGGCFPPFGGLTPFEIPEVLALIPPSYFANKVFKSLAIAGLSFLAKFLKVYNPVF